MKRLTVTIICLCCLIFDLAAAYTQFLRVPFMLFSACLALAVLLPVWNSVTLATVGGLCIDFLRNDYLGVTPALYILAVCVFSFFNHKTKRPILAVFAGTFFLAIQLCFAAAALLMGRDLPYLKLLILRCLLPTALSALFCVVLKSAFDRMLFGRRRI